MASDAAVSVAALAAAGDDTAALCDAIEHAAFLDAVPGENRQKLRGAWHAETLAQFVRHREHMPPLLCFLCSCTHPTAQAAECC